MSDAHIRASRLSFSWPDGTPVLDELSFAITASRTGLVARNGAGKSTLLRLLAGELPPTSGGIDVHGRVAYLPQHPHMHADACVADLLGVASRLRALDAVLGGSADVADYEQADGHWDLRERIAATLERLGLDGVRLDRPLSTLSGGEVMSLALAAKLLENPDVLLLDEPSNHLDRDARRRLRDVLSQWRGCLLVASHDRDLLEGMEQTAVLAPSALRLHGGGYSFHRQAVQAEQHAAEQRVRQLQGEVRRQQREQQQARERAQRRAGNAARNLADAGLARIVAGNRERAAQVSAGKADTAHARRLADARQRLGEAAQALERDVTADFALPATRVAADRVLFHGTGLRVQAGARAIFGQDGVSLTIRGPERMALMGGNGAGKTTLLEILSGVRAPDDGTVHRAGVRVATLPQRLDLLDPARSIAENLALYAPTRTPAERAQLLARLQFRGTRMSLPAGALSGGERLRATLLCVLHAEPAPQLLLLDEPTNNLDLDTTAHLERALCGYEGALVVVSHDDRFLDAVGVQRRLTLSDGRLHG